MNLQIGEIVFLISLLRPPLTGNGHGNLRAFHGNAPTNPKPSHTHRVGGRNKCGPPV